MKRLPPNPSNYIQALKNNNYTKRKWYIYKERNIHVYQLQMTNYQKQTAKLRRQFKTETKQQLHFTNNETLHQWQKWDANQR